MFRILIFSLVISLAGCMTNSLAPEPIDESSLSETSGILVGSFSRDPSAPDYYRQRFYFKNIATGVVHTIDSQPAFNMFSGKTRDDFMERDSQGGVFAFSLVAGDYTFYDFHLFQSSGGYYQHWNSKEHYDIPFTVEPNKVSYVGEIKLSPITRENKYGTKVNVGGVWLISNQEERDVALLAEKHPQIPIEKLINIIPNEKKVFTPLVILPSEVEKHDEQVE